MLNVILAIHILACIAMTGVILLQRSEGGALGIGGGGGGLMSGRGVAGALVRTTMIFGGIFFLTSLALTTIANRTADNRSIIEQELGEEIPGLDLGDPLDSSNDLLPAAEDLDPLADPGLPPLPDAEEVKPVETNTVPEARESSENDPQ